MRDFLAIVGPTGTGKTGLSIALAKHLEVEIVCMDSRQGYIGMDIGTDKVSKEVRTIVPHHGFDCRTPDQSYSAGQFARDAIGWIKEIKGRECVPMLVGGTGLFLRAVTHPIFSEPKVDESRRNFVREMLAGFPRAKLERWVKSLDPDRAEIAIQGGPQRLIRTIEVALLTGRSLSWWHKMGTSDRRPLGGVVVILEVPRDVLDVRINNRVNQMIEEGLIGEVQGLLNAGFEAKDPGMTGTGYREIASYLEGMCSLDQALETTKKRTRKYARRQFTWFKNQHESGTLRIDGTESLEVQCSKVLTEWTKTHGM